MEGEIYKKTLLSFLAEKRMGQADIERKLGHHKGWTSARFNSRQVHPKTIHATCEALGVAVGVFLDRASNYQSDRKHSTFHENGNGGNAA